MNGPRRRSWAEEMAQAGFQMMVLPWRLLGLGLQAMTQAVDGAPRDAGHAGQGRLGMLPSVVPYPGGLVGLEDKVRPTPAEIERSQETFTGDVAGPAVAVASPVGQETFAGGAASGGAAAGCSETHVKEDKNMSCCDQDMSGCDLKIVQYSIVSVDPYIDYDEDRIVLRDHPVLTIATQDDMTDADFTAYAIALAQRRYPGELDRYRAQYLRVCFKVICRFTMPCADYEKDQAEALRAINRTLRREKGLPAESREDRQLARREERAEAREEAREEPGPGGPGPKGPRPPRV
jgi:hypothetical protein